MTTEIEQVLSEAQQIDYEIHVEDSATAAQAYVDNVAVQGGWPVSMSVDPVGRYVFLTAWPRVSVAAP